MPDTFYPAVNSILSVDRLPDPVKDIINKVGSKLFYKTYYVEKSKKGDVAYHYINLVFNSDVGFNLLGGEEGFELLFNPGELEDTTELPLAIYYNLPILKYTNNLSVNDLGSPKEYFNIIVKIFKASEGTVVLQVINSLFEYSIEAFVDHFNNNPNYSSYAPILSNYSGNDDEIVSDIINQLKTQGVDVYLYVLEEIIAVENDIPQSLDNLYTVFKDIMGDFTFEDLLKLFIPQVSVSIQKLEVALAFPRTWLLPVSENGDVIEGDLKSKLSYNAGSLVYDTEKGFEFSDIGSFSLDKSQIGNTGLLVEINDLKLDLRDDQNIPEAIADGRPDNFKGVYAQLAAITLPKNWFDNEDNHPGTTARIAGYDVLIGTGGVSGTIALEALALSDDDVYDYYSDSFSFQYPISITSDGVSETIETYGDLIIYFNSLNGELYTFDFPLNAVRKDTNENVQISDQTAYSEFLENFTEEGTLPVRLIKKIGGNGFAIWFNSFDITFKQNRVTESNIQGGLKIPRLKDANGDDAEIDIFGHFDDSGDFLVSASEKDGFKPWMIPGVLDFKLYTAELGKEGDDFFIGCSCDILFTNPLMKSLVGEQPIQIQSMRFYSDGSFEILGGTIPVAANFTLNLGPVEVNVTNINLGSYQQEYKGETRKYMVFGFDGALDLGPMGIEARGKGMQFYFTVDDGEFHSEFRIQTIEVDLIIPGSASPELATAIIKGYLSIPEPGESPVYAGGVSISLPQLKIAGSAEFELQPRYPAFIVDAKAEIPVPIPIVPPVSINGFRGLLGFRYIAEREAIGLSEEAGDTWYDYYKYPERGINVKKFRGPNESENTKDAFSIGAGATLVSSDGSIISARVMLMLSIPSVFIFDGKANVLSEAVDLDSSTEPPFFATVAIDSNSLLIGAGVNYRHPMDTGNLITIDVSMEAYFPFRNSSAWYIHIGSMQNPSKLRLFSLIDMAGYLMLSAKGMEVGAFSDFEFSKRFGPARVKASLSTFVGGKISFERPQIGGYLGARGSAEVKFWVIEVGISFNSILGAEAPKPFRLYASVEVCGKIKIGFIKIKKCIDVDVKWEKSKRVDTSPILPLPKDIANQNVKGVSMLTGEAYNLLYIKNRTSNTSAPTNDFPVLPLDTYVDMKFLKPVNGNKKDIRDKIYGVSNRPKGSIENIPPDASSRGNSFRQVEHRYSIDEIDIETWNGSRWVNYNPYEAIPIEGQNVDISRKKIGYWQKAGTGYNAIRILGNNPFSYIQRGEPGWFIPEQTGISSSSLFCEYSGDYWQVANWRNVSIGRIYPLVNIDFGVDISSATASNVYTFYTHQNLSFTIIGNQYTQGGNRSGADYAKVTKAYSQNFDHSRGLQFSNSNPLVLKYKNSVRQARFQLNTGAKGASFIFYRSVFTDTDSKVYFEEFDTVYRTAAELQEEFEYASEGRNTISQVKIVPDMANIEEIALVREQIDSLQEVILDIEIENIEEPEASQQAELARLLNRLTTLEEEGCQKRQVISTGIGNMMITDDFIVGKTDESAQRTTESNCNTVLFEASWLADYDYQLNVDLPNQAAITEEFRDAEKSITEVVEPIWRPDAQYRIHFKLTDTVVKKGGDNEIKHDEDYYFGFATSGPVGHYPAPTTYGVYKSLSSKVELTQSIKDKYAHTSLRQYIDYKRSYPDANGNLLQSKPLFYGTADNNNKLSIFFLKSYAYHMFQKWDNYLGLGEANIEMELLVKDPVEDITLQNPPDSTVEQTTIPETKIEWTEDTNALFPKEHQMFNNLAQSDNCMGVDSVITKPKSYLTEVTVNNMRPLKMYTAIVNSKYKKPGSNTYAINEVHNYAFQTSRYLDFNEQVNSYLLIADTESEIKEIANKAIFTIEASVNKQNLTSAYNILNGEAQTDNNSKSLEGDKIDLFDRVVHGLLDMKPLDPATTTEFNFIKDTETGATIAMLIRNPEPFNDPKIEREVIDGTLRKENQGFAVMSGSNVDNDYKTVYSKDYSQILVMHKMNNQIAITAESLDMKFTYLLWNGFEYKKQSSVTVSDILTTTKG